MIPGNKIRLNHGRIFLIFLISSFILYGQTIWFGFTELDDSILIVDDYEFISNVENAGVLFLQTVFKPEPESHDIYFRPLLMLSFMLDSQIAGTSPAFYHFMNIIWHFIAVFLMFLLFSKLKYKIDLAFVVSLLFLCHPAITAAIAWIPGRNDSMLTVFILGSFINLINYIQNRRLTSLFYHLTFFILSLLTKEIAILAPILFYTFLMIQGSEQGNVKFIKVNKSNVLIIFGWIFSCVIYFVLRNNIINEAEDVRFMQIIKLFSGSAPVIIQYIGKLILPFNLSTYPKMEDTYYIYGIVSLIIMFYFIIKKRIYTPKYFWFGFIWMITFLLPLGMVSENALEHRLYLPAIGFCFMLIENRVFQFWSVNQIRWISISMCILFCILTVLHTKHFENSDTFWKKAWNTSPHSAVAHMHMGIKFQVDGNNIMAIKEYETALQLNPKIKNTRNNLGRIFLNVGNILEAEKLFKKEMEINPSSMPLYNLALIEERRGNIMLAKQLLNQSLKFDSSNVKALVDLGILYAMDSSYDKSLMLLNRAILLDPSNLQANKNLTLLYLVNNQYDYARKYFSISKNLGVVFETPGIDSLVMK